jgi:hypothetical protein
MAERDEGKMEFSDDQLASVVFEIEKLYKSLLARGDVALCVILCKAGAYPYLKCCLLGGHHSYRPACTGKKHH